MDRRRGTILVVDDELQSRSLLINILTSEGYEVRAADRGDLALAYVAVVRPELILLDMRMPGMDGLEVCRQLKGRKESRDIPVVFISASTDAESRVEALELGAVDFLSKPFNRPELLARVQTHMELSRLRFQLEEQVAKRTEELRSTVERLQQEIAERQRTEQALHESEQRFRSMANNAPVLIVVTDANCQTTFFNKTWLDFTGRTMEQELGMGWTAGLHPDDREACLTAIEASFQAQRECHLEYRLRRADGQYRSVICRGIPRFETGGVFTGYIGSLIDITDLKKSQAAALANQKLESLGVLAGGIAHDFNNLLGSILANLELLVSDLAGASPAQEGLEKIKVISMRASEIVRQLMVYAGEESAVYEKVDLAGLVREMLQLMKLSITKNAVLKIDVPTNVPLVRGNPAQLRQVVMNLITNASDALGETRGAISVMLTPVHIRNESALEEGSEALSGNFLRLEVRDSGCGMPEGVRARIFDPFFSTKRAGRGMGLAAVRGIILSHGGTIKVHTTPGSGSCFEVLLPCVRQAEEECPEVVIPALPSGNESVTATVLIIEDEDMLRVPIASMLRRKGFSILEAGEGVRGLDLFQAHATEIELVLLDLTLPGMSGREILGKLQKLRPGIKVVLATAYGRDRAFADVSDPQSVYYLRKPYKIEELTALLRRVSLDEPEV